jgi:hypothetical protein
MGYCYECNRCHYNAHVRLSQSAMYIYFYTMEGIYYNIDIGIKLYLKLHCINRIAFFDLAKINNYINFQSTFLKKESGGLCDYHAVSVAPSVSLRKLLNQIIDFMKFSIEVMSLKVTSTP